MDFKDNIFLKAAFTGEIEGPLTNQNCNNTSKQNVPTEPPKQTKQTKHRYSELEDLMIIKAVEMKGRNWRVVLTFMKQNSKILGKEGEVGDCGMQDRLRKGASFLLNKGKEKYA